MSEGGNEEGIAKQLHHGNSTAEPADGTTAAQEKILHDMIEHTNHQEGLTGQANINSILEPKVAKGLTKEQQLELTRIVIRTEAQQNNIPVKPNSKSWLNRQAKPPTT